MNILNKLALLKARYFTSATCPLDINLNWMSGPVVKHHKRQDPLASCHRISKLLHNSLLGISGKCGIENENRYINLATSICCKCVAWLLFKDRATFTIIRLSCNIYITTIRNLIETTVSDISLVFLFSGISKALRIQGGAYIRNVF